MDAGAAGSNGDEGVASLASDTGSSFGSTFGRHSIGAAGIGLTVIVTATATGLSATAGVAAWTARKLAGLAA